MTIMDYKGLYRAIEDDKGLYRTIQDYAGLYRTAPDLIQDYTELFRTIQVCTGLLRTVEYERQEPAPPRGQTPTSFYHGNFSNQPFVQLFHQKSQIFEKLVLALAQMAVFFADFCSKVP